MDKDKDDKELWEAQMQQVFEELQLEDPLPTEKEQQDRFFNRCVEKGVMELDGDYVKMIRPTKVTESRAPEIIARREQELLARVKAVMTAKFEAAGFKGKDLTSALGHVERSYDEMLEEGNADLLRCGPKEFQRRADDLVEGFENTAVRRL